MKSLLVVMVILLCGCSNLMHGARQPVKMISNKGVYMTTCAGAVEAWNDCYDKASETCGSDYEVLSKDDNNHGTRRGITFKCKK